MEYKEALFLNIPRQRISNRSLDIIDYFLIALKYFVEKLGPSWTKLVQIRFLKSAYLGQHNEDGTQINLIITVNTLSLGLLRAYV